MAQLVRALSSHDRGPWFESRCVHQNYNKKMPIFNNKKSNFEWNIGGIARAVFAYLLELVQVVLVSLAIIIPIRYFLVQPFYVKGASMEPSFYDHEYLIIDEISYRFREPQRGDIVVFRYPLDPNQFFIKRIIGLPGEKIRISGGQIMVFNKEDPQGTILDENIYLGQIFTAGEKTINLNSDEYYLLGDNRTASLDSRIFGPVKNKLIVGRVWLRGWPLTRLGSFDAPTYNNIRGN